MSYMEPEQLTLYNMRLISGKSGSSVTRSCGITYRSLRNWETGVAVPNIVNVHDLLQIYGYSFYELDLAPFYEVQPYRAEKQKRIITAARKRTPVSNPPKSLSLHDMRKVSGYTGVTVSEICEISYRSLLNWEKGSSIPNVVNINDLLDIYGYSFYELDLSTFHYAFKMRVRKQIESDPLAKSADNQLL
ncbi:helix-turn-helix transcriptional regulator [Salipaludibacillus agaradhaerens]|uniref:helix-turn-helix domain-containing protein n=1 Tax=Salipaludibacillus agaradhaerens TaxID=76935 RepID=UPI002150BE7A|nr:helix-turn-helix transcriptional regulator [Salipaludibacillus agaradhaerens]MCR6120644.1 helix-turn-helix transcriptional regulator [Salipaludibacillus agaradhaerens]